ncbi:MAG: hypothetical protein HFH45_01555 [Bacilli bacterium]|nr:hypothetical protein [Bacilli bacterium]
MKKHRKTRNKRKKHRKLIILSVISFLCIMSAGYAAFQTHLNIAAKGNIKEMIAAKYLKKQVITSGDGLYEDIYEEGRYTYKGANPNNYIKFNDEMWRIMSVENNNTLKIIRNEHITIQSWDQVGNRNNTVDTYCQETNNYGCNIWAATNNLVGSPSDFITYNPTGNKNTATEIIKGKVTKDSTVNTYLNTEYYNNMQDKEKINTGPFYVGSPGNHNDDETWSSNIMQEKAYIWQGKVGLMTISEYVRANPNITTCNSLSAGFKSASDCGQNNYLNKGSWEQTITPSSESTLGIATIRENGSITNSNTNSNYKVRPVIYTFSNITLTGEGTESNPYIIKNA